MKKYEFGFYAESGEFFSLGEYGFDDGKTLYVTAKNGIDAYNQFVSALDDEYCGDNMTVREVPTGHDMNDYMKL